MTSAQALCWSRAEGQQLLQDKEANPKMQRGALRVCSNVQHPEGCRAMVHLLYVLAHTFGVLSPSLQRIVEVVLAKPHPGMVCGEVWPGLQPGTPEPRAPWDHHECICVCTCVHVSACVHTQACADRVPW